MPITFIAVLALSIVVFLAISFTRRRTDAVEEPVANISLEQRVRELAVRFDETSELAAALTALEDEVRRQERQFQDLRCRVQDDESPSRYFGHISGWLGVVGTALDEIEAQDTDRFSSDENDAAAASQILTLLATSPRLE